MLLFYVNARTTERVGPDGGLGSGECARLLERLAITDGTPVFLEEASIQPVEPWCSWGRRMAYKNRATGTMRKTAQVILRVEAFAAQRGKSLLTLNEWDLKAYELARTRLQEKPVSDVTWDTEMRLLDGVYGWLVEEHLIRSRPVRPGLRGRNPLIRGLAHGMDIRHLTLEQYRYFRDIGLAGLLPDSRPSSGFRGSNPLRSRAAADLALSTGMRQREWSTVLLPELGIDTRRPGEPAVFGLQACAKCGRAREVYVPPDTLDAMELYLLLERPAIVAASAASLGRRRGELFVVERVVAETGMVHGLLHGSRHVVRMDAMDAALRSIAVVEGESGLEALALFVGRGGRMVSPSRWAEIRCDAWRRMKAQADDSTPLLPTRRWRWHDLRHTFALQLLSYLELQIDGPAADAAARRRRHRGYLLSEHIRRNPLLIVSRRLGHSDPATTYQYLQYADDPGAYLDEVFERWIADSEATYADIAAHVLGPAAPAAAVR